MGTQKEHITQNANEDGYFFLLKGLKIFVTHPPVGSILQTTGAVLARWRKISVQF